jgi:hypothetical protein
MRELVVAVRRRGIDLHPAGDGEERAEDEANADDEEAEREHEVHQRHEDLRDRLRAARDRRDRGVPELDGAVLRQLEGLHVLGLEASAFVPFTSPEPVVPVTRRHPLVVGRAGEDLRERAEVERELPACEEEVPAARVEDLVDLRAGGCVAALGLVAGTRDRRRRAHLLDGDVVEEAPGRGDGDDRGRDPAEHGDGNARARREEAHHDVDVDVLALRGGERCAKERKPERQALRDLACAAEEDEDRRVLEPREEVREVRGAGVTELRAGHEADQGHRRRDDLAASVLLRHLVRDRAEDERGDERPEDHSGAGAPCRGERADADPEDEREHLGDQDAGAEARLQGRPCAIDLRERRAPGRLARVLGLRRRRRFTIGACRLLALASARPRGGRADLLALLALLLVAGLLGLRVIDRRGFVGDGLGPVVVAVRVRLFLVCHFTREGTRGRL